MQIGAHVRQAAGRTTSSLADCLGGLASSANTTHATVRLARANSIGGRESRARRADSRQLRALIYQRARKLATSLGAAADPANKGAPPGQVEHLERALRKPAPASEFIENEIGRERRPMDRRRSHFN